MGLTRRLWAAWDEHHDRRLAASQSEVEKFAEAGLKNVIAVCCWIIVRIVSVTGGQGTWLVNYEIPAAWAGGNEIYNLADTVTQTMTELQDPSSAAFGNFVRGAEAEGSSLK